MTSQKSSCSTGACDCYQRGAADARRTVEAELAAERAALAMLASSLADAVENIQIHVHPDDAEWLDVANGPPVEIDPALMRGKVRISEGVGAPRQF